MIDKVNSRKILLAGTAILSVASTIPGTRLITSLALRSFALLSATTFCAESWKKGNVYSRVLHITRIGIVALAIVGVAASKPIIFVTSLAAQVAFDAIEIGFALHKRDYKKAFFHLNAFVIDSLLLGAIVSGSWQVMVTALAVNAFCMIIRISAMERWDFESFCYLMMAVSSEISLIDALKSTQTWEFFHAPERITNNTDSTMEISVNKHGVGLGGHYTHDATLKPGEHYDTSYNYFYQITRNPLPSSFYPTLPVGGTAIVLPDPK